MDIQMLIMNDIESKNELRKLGFQHPIVILNPNSTKKPFDNSVIHRSDGYRFKSINLKALKNDLLASLGDNRE